MNAQTGNPTSLPTWKKPGGAPVACTEKIKVLNENYGELRQLMLDALDDALLMGCSEAQVRAAFHELVEQLVASYPEAED